MKHRNKLLIIIGIPLALILGDYQIAKALTFTVSQNFNSLSYDDENDFGLTNWQVDGNNLLNQSGWFYRIGNSDPVNSIGTLTASNFTNNGSLATITYSDSSNFAIDLVFSLTNSGATLNQSGTVRNISGSALDFYLYSYNQLNTSSGNSGDSVTIDGSNFTATQSGDLTEITTTINQTINGTNTSLNSLDAEADIIDNNNDTLFDNLLFGTGELNNNLTASSNDDPISFAYEWNYNLDSNESFQVITTTTNNTAAVPLEFSPSLGLIGISIGVASYHLRKRQSKN
jgi:hypothetical protein